ncbi:MAG: chemotaxis protein CheA [Gemmataceae bacterium]|nr:chemotaxis protein CheA [Gemmataceae bacterium]
MSDQDDIVREFLTESYDNLDQLDRDLVSLEKDTRNKDCLARIFRTIHTIKGTCGFFGFGKLEALTHVGENLLSKLRDGVLFLTPTLTTALLAMVDAVRQLLDDIEKTGQEGARDNTSLQAKLTDLLNPDGDDAPAAIVAEPEPIHEYRERKPIGETLIEAGAVKAEDVQAALSLQAAGDPRHVGEILVEQHALNPQDLVQSLKAQQDAPTSQLSESNIRVDVGLLDKLMNLVGELVLARNQILQYTATQKDTNFLSTSQRLNLITTELQEGVMKTRMQPIGNIWSRFPRVVRDLATMCGKQVRIEMEGKETELDKTIIEAIKDPLTHVVRNSVDHGIEGADLRVSRGKPAEGCLRLRAFHEGGQVNIEITDDGGGIDPARIKKKALERGLITRDQAERMSDRECVQLIFLPGFSTAEKISNISGRGVGMDVVKTNIEKIGGAIDVQSQYGKGTTLKIKIPLTLAIIPALIVTSGGDRYAIPQVNLLELVRLAGDQVKGAIERIHGAPVYRLRGRLLPLVYLNKALNVESCVKATEEGTINIVVLQADDRQFGLVVDGINDTEEIVVKPLGKQLKGIPLFAGATIMGDGKVALILDVMGVAQMGGIISEIRDRGLGDLASRSQEIRSDRQSLLIFGIGRSLRMAIPLSLVARLEELPATSIEMADQREVVQYRGQIMPLIRLGGVLGVGDDGTPKELLQVVVYSEGGRSVGLVVDRILDIVETPSEMQRQGGRNGILGSTVIQQRVTDLLDVPGIIRTQEPEFFGSKI